MNNHIQILLLSLSFLLNVLFSNKSLKPRSHEGLRPCCDLCKTSHVVKSQVDLIRARNRGKFNNASALGRSFYWCQALHIMNKDRYQSTSARRALTLLNSPRVLVIGNSNINKIGSREVFDNFYEPGSAVDDSSRCIHVFKSFSVLSQLDRIKMQK